MNGLREGLFDRRGLRNGTRDESPLGFVSGIHPRYNVGVSQSIRLTGLYLVGGTLRHSRSGIFVSPSASRLWSGQLFVGQQHSPLGRYPILKP